MVADITDGVIDWNTKRLQRFLEKEKCLCEK